MIKPEERLWASGGNLLIGGPYTWYIVDFDQRRHFSVTYCPPFRVQDTEATEEICLEKLRKHIDDLATDILGIRFADPDGPISASTDEEDDATSYANCHPPSALGLPFPVKTIGLSSLTELDRMGPQVDLVTYPAEPTVGGMTGTKCWARLPRDHPHIVPFHAVVVDDIRGGVVGFTSLYIPGGTLEQNKHRPFRLVWLQQLLSVVDDLNYRYGIMHQDIAPRNLVIDAKDNLCIFDFGLSIMIDQHYTSERDDVKGVIFTLYEIITLDDHFRGVPHIQQDADAVVQLERQKHPDAHLDSGVQEFRDVLDTWVKKRRTREFKLVDTCIQWLLMPQPPEVLSPVKGPDGAMRGKEAKSAPTLSRPELVEMNEPYFNWERPLRCPVRRLLSENWSQSADEP
ncbi:hypothetical protein NLG97_g8053 [Lecanicillium saksenae]|uniref:Uncharacterized protein n=1 Tax=Lecanicillium saksenae TaxID=468837 RepID=A0ACC1QN12_9HYPO|nr:hypothetical protein NLG97_g8053 [Lecanicillium saksenae]